MSRLVALLMVFVLATAVFSQVQQNQPNTKPEVSPAVAASPAQPVAPAVKEASDFEKNIDSVSICIKNKLMSDLPANTTKVTDTIYGAIMIHQKLTVYDTISGNYYTTDSIFPITCTGNLGSAYYRSGKKEVKEFLTTEQAPRRVARKAVAAPASKPIGN